MNREEYGFGQKAEDAACRFLRGRGYDIVARNWRCRFGEIDIIARDGAVLVFVEVKARSGTGHGGAEGAVNRHKQRRLISTARQFLAQTGCELAARFDVVTFVGHVPTLYRDAFEANGG